MTEITKLLDSLTPRQFEQLLYEAEKRGLVSRRAAVGVVDVDKPKQEPVKLYCVKSYKPGEWLTKGRVYEFDGNQINYDNSCAYFKDYKDWKRGNPFLATCLVPLVKRRANVGEWVYVVNAICTYGNYKTGDVIQIVEPWEENTPTAYYKTAAGCFFFDDEYLVLDGYQPEPYSGKVVCVESDGDFTVGKLYEFKDGKVVDDNGNMRPMAGDRVATLEDWNSKRSRLARFIEFKGL